MENYRVIVADDEPLTRERIAGLVKNYSKFKIVCETSNGADTVDAIKRDKPDVIFLDIKMPLLNGFEVLEKLKSDNYKILVFITAYDQFAIKAFENEALDYLLKPFDNQRFDKLMKRVEKHLVNIYKKPDRYILARVNNEIIKINTKDIIFLKSNNNYIQIYLNNHVYRKRISMAAVLEELGDHFFRIHRSYIINEREIKKMKHICHGDYLFSMSNGKSIASSKSYRKTVELMTK